MLGQKKASTKELLIAFGILASIGGAIGAITGLGLSFTDLPILDAGAIIAAVPAMLFCAFAVYTDYRDNQLSLDDIIYLFISIISICLASAAIGVGLAAAATAIFPGVMLSAAALGGLIGAIAPIAGFFVVALIIKPIVDQVTEETEEFVVGLYILALIGGTIGAFIGLGLSFTALPALAEEQLLLLFLQCYLVHL